MRQTRVYMGVLLLGLGLLGAYLGALAQDHRNPWPPPPLKIPPSDAAEDDPPALIRVKAEEEKSSGQPEPDPPPPAGHATATEIPAPENGPNATADIGPSLLPQGPVVPLNGPEPKKLDAVPTTPMLPADGPKSADNLIIDDSAAPPLPAAPASLTHELPLENQVSPTPLKSTELIEPPPPVRAVVPIRRHSSVPETPASPGDVISKSLTSPEIPLANKTRAPLLTLEKRGPESVTLGQPVRYEIVVHNVGSVAALQVRIEDTLAEGVRFLGGNPQPILQGARVVWNLDEVPADSEKKLYLDLQPTAMGELVSQTSMTLAVGSQTQIVAPALELSVTGPGRVGVGQAAVFEVHLTNSSGRRLTGIILYAQLSKGLTHPMGNTFEGNVGDLGPGASKNITLRTKAAQPGRHLIEVRLLAQDREEARARAKVYAGESGLALLQPASTRLVLDRVSNINIEAANFLAKPVRSLMVTSTLPEGVEYQNANEHGLYRSQTHSVHWVLDYLPQEQTRMLTVTVKPRTAGTFSHSVSARGPEGIKAQSKGQVVVEGASQLTMKIADRDDPVEVGRETAYEIRVVNEGNAADTAVQIQATVPDGMVPRSAGGPAAYRIQGQQVVFEPLARLDAKKEAVFVVRVLAQTPGDRRLRVQLTSSQTRLPLTREERTLVYRD